MPMMNGIRAPRNVLVTVVLLCAVGSAGAAFRYGMITLSRSPVASAPVLKLSRKMIDLGVMRPGESRSEEIHVENCGTDVLQLSEIKTSCGCTPARVDATEIAPGAETILHIDTKAPMNASTISHFVSFQTNLREAAVVQIPIVGKAQWSVEASATRVDVGLVKPGENVSRGVELYSPESTSFEIVEWLPSVPWITVHRVTSEVKSRRHQVEITVQNEERVGAFNELITFRTTSSDRPNVVVAVCGKINAVSVSGPSHVMLGPLQPREEKRMESVLEVDTVSDVVSDVRILDAEWSLVRWSTETVGDHRIQLCGVLLAPLRRGYNRTKLEIYTGTPPVKSHTIGVSCLITSLHPKVDALDPGEQ